MQSPTSWLARNSPLWRSRQSTSVVLPWSTWAMMAILRMSLRRMSQVRSTEDKGRKLRHLAAAFMPRFGGDEVSQMTEAARVTLPGASRSNAAIELAAVGRVSEQHSRPIAEAKLRKGVHGCVLSAMVQGDNGRFHLGTGPILGGTAAAGNRKSRIAFRSDCAHPFRLANVKNLLGYRRTWSRMPSAPSGCRRHHGLLLIPLCQEGVSGAGDTHTR